MLYYIMLTFYHYSIKIDHVQNHVNTFSFTVFR
nr:MAG TPA: hypothetical protein [Caudoviricetes sp.]